MTTIDLIILAVIIISFVLGLYRGFVRTVVGCIGGILSFIGAGYIASHFSDGFSQTFIAPKLSANISESLNESLGSSSSAATVWDSQSEYLQGLLRGAGVSEDTLSAASHPVETLSNAIASSVGHSIAYAVLFLAGFIVCLIALHLVSNALHLVTRLPVLHSCNALLGGVLGAVFGLALCTCVLMALKLFVPAIYSNYGMLPPSEMSRSPIASTLVGWNDGVSLFEVIPAES